MEGMNSYSSEEKAAHSPMTTKKPSSTPTLKGKALLKPYFAAFDMDIIVFGPGVIAVSST